MKTIGLAGAVSAPDARGRPAEPSPRLNLDAHATVGSWLEAMREGGVLVPLALCRGVSQAMRELGLAFPELWDRRQPEVGESALAKSPARLLIVRHAESEANLRRLFLELEGSADHELGRAMRDADVPLTSRGRAQARAAGRGLGAERPFDVLYVSPYRRTQETADEIAAVLVPPPRVVVEKRLRERYSCAYENRRRRM